MCSSDLSYTDRKLRFKHKYQNKSIDQLGEAVCDFGLEFHVKFIEDCIEYIFNIWTQPSKTKSEHHEFYFKMLYYYDVIGVVIWAQTIPQKMKSMYDKYVLPDPPVKPNAKKEKREEKTLIREIGKTKCSWCPDTTQQMYNTALTSTLSRFAKQIEKTPKGPVKVDSSVLPVGHILRDVPHFYIPESGWSASAEYETKKNWKENDIIIGFSDKSRTGVHVRFKIRPPIHKMRKVEDVRQQQRGTICSSSISKSKLIKIAESIGINVKKISVGNLCNEIKARLMYLDLEERRKGTNIKWFYNYFEKQPV